MRTRFVLLFAAILLSAGLYAQQLEEQNGGYVITGNGYRAEVPQGRMLTSFAVNGTELLQSQAVGAATSFFNNGAIASDASVQRNGNTIVCTVQDAGTMTYEFTPEGVTITAQSTIDKYCDFFMAFSERTAGVFAQDGKLSKLFCTLQPGEYKWVRDSAAVVTRGEAVFWGPWSGCELLQLALEPGTKRSVSLTAASVSFEEQKEALFASMPCFAEDENKGLVLDSPAEYQVFQRSSKYEGRFYFSGKVTVPFDAVQYRITGTGINGEKYSSSWKSLEVNKATGYFGRYVDGWAGGWYKIEVRVRKGSKTVDSIVLDHVGIGEVFVGAGQSNSTNNAEFPIKQTLGMSSTTDGRTWRINDDPMLGHHDGTQGGSYYPAMADRLYEKIGVPIGIASTGHGATAIAHWLPGTELYNYMMGRIRQLGKNGFRAVLWHQGESDAPAPVNPSLVGMQAIIQASKADAGWEFPWFVAKVSYHSVQNPRWPNIRKAHQLLWNMGIALQGPDTDQLKAEYRDFTGIHFNVEGLMKHGEMWADLLALYIKEWEEANP